MKTQPTKLAAALLAVSCAVATAQTHAARTLDVKDGDDITGKLKTCLADLKANKKGTGGACPALDGADNVVILNAGTYKLSNSVNIDTRVVLKGRGKSKTFIKVDEKNYPVSKPSMFNVAAQNVKFQSMTINGLDKTKVIIKPVEFGTNGNGVKGLYLQSVKIKASDIYTDLVGHPSGVPMSGLKVKSSNFEKGRVALNLLNRKWNTGGLNEMKVPTMAKTEISGSTFTDQKHASIAVDCANDSGRDGKTDETTLTSMSGSEWYNNTIINTITDSEFGIAVTQANDFVIRDNPQITAYRDALHMEYRTQDVSIHDNPHLEVLKPSGTRENVRLSVGDSNRFFYIDSVKKDEKDADKLAGTGFEQYSSKEDDRHQNGPRNIVVTNNGFVGAARRGVNVVEGEDVRIENNDLTNFTAQDVKILLESGGDGSKTYHKGCVDCSVTGNKGVAKADVRVNAPGDANQNHE